MQKVRVGPEKVRTVTADCNRKGAGNAFLFATACNRRNVTACNRWTQRSLEGYCRRIHWLEQIRDAMERDTRRRGFEGRQHGCRRQRAHTVFMIQLVHRREQAGAARAVLERVEKIQRMQPVGNQAVQLHPDEIGLVVLRARGRDWPTAGSGPQSASGCPGIHSGAARCASRVSGTPKRLTGALACPRAHGEADRPDRCRWPRDPRRADAWRPCAAACAPPPRLFQGSASPAPARAEWLMRFVVLGLRHVEVLAAQPVPQALAPDRSPKLAGLLAVEGQQLRPSSRSPLPLSRFSVRAPMPGRSRSVSRLSASGRMSRGKATRPSGFSMSLAILAR